MNTIPFLSPLLVAVSLIVAGAGAGDETTTCPGALSMTVESACRNVSHTQAMYDACKGALAGVPNPMSDHDATVYALAAARGAMASADATVVAANEQVTYNGSLSGEEKGAYEGCVEAYAAAEHTPWAPFGGGLADDYMSGLLAVESCRDRVIKLPASPL
uniref:Pectinesterase inhibitor domain-containing protein n=1 Tax=Oryza glumipatula TaxID=40148 RepID=A0A0E0AQQ4_9ORYZ